MIFIASAIRSFSRDPIKQQGRDWQLHTVEKLNEKTQIDRRRVLQIRELQVWTKTLREAFGGAEETQDEAGRAYAFARLAEGISIGSESFTSLT